MTALAFLQALWPEGIEDPSRLLLWTLPDKKSSWFSSLAVAAKQVQSLRTHRDVYLGVGLQVPPEQRHQRGSAATVTAIPAVYADLDLDVPGHHKGKSYFRDVDEAQAFLRGLPLQPTLIVHSGGGLHAWWCFHEPWIFEDDTELQKAARLARGWNLFLSEEAAKIDREVDAVGDLARVLRVPGSYNHKTGKRLLVRLLQDDGPRIDPSELEPWEAAQMPSKRKSSGGSGLVLNPDAAPPFDKFQVLADVEPKFKASWEHRRTGMKDTSCSAYDMSLATHAALADWSEQEIADLLIAHRRKHGADLKLRQDYYRRTIGRAMDKKRDEQETEELFKQPKEQVTLQNREKALDFIRKTTGVPIRRLVVHGKDRPVYSVYVDSGENVVLGNGRQAMSFHSWKEIAWIHGRGEIPTKVSAKIWSRCLMATRQILEDETSEDAKEVNVLRGWVKQLTAAAPEIDDNVERSEFIKFVLTGEPFRMDGKIYLQLESLVRHIRVVQKRNMTEAQVLRLLKMGGFELAVIQGRLEGQKKLRRFWAIDSARVDP